MKALRKINNYIISKNILKCGSNFTAGKNLIIHGKKNIIIGNNFSCADNCEISFWKLGHQNNSSSYIQIGNNVKMAQGSYISCINKVVISDGCLLGSNTFITDNFHGTNSSSDINISPNDRELISRGPVFLGENVWTGRNVCIMPGVSIGKGSIIGANAVVTHDIPEYSVAVGVPAKVIRSFHDII